MTIELNLKNLRTTFDSNAIFLFMLTFATCANPWLISTFIDSIKFFCSSIYSCQFYDHLLNASPQTKGRAYKFENYSGITIWG